MVTNARADLAARRTVIAGVAVTGFVLVAGLLWAKWLPYVAKATAAARTHSWPGKDILRTGGVRPGDAPTWHAATTFFHAYMSAIWPALVVALVVSACVQALVPRAWLPRLLNRRSLVTSGLAGGVASMPSMMCACCAAPVAVTLRRSGVDRSAAVAYWLGNPLLNPAVLVFLVFVAPWQWSLVRLVIGVAAVLAAATLVGLVSRRTPDPAPAVEAPVSDSDDASAGRRFVAALARLCLVLLPEYLVIVLLIGAGRGWLLSAVEPGRHGVLLVVGAAVLGTLLVIPTAGEIPILTGLALLGVSSGVLGALLITLPAVSLPGAAMVARSFGWRALGVTGATVVVAGLAAAAALSVL